MNAWIGTDESGKGDYFGALVIAGVMVDETTIPKLKELGIKDSKKLSDSKAKLLSEAIQKLCPFDVVAIGPPKYNELYSKLRNLNRILAWGHARVIENLLSQVSCDTVIADKFGDKIYIEKALMARGKQIKLIQRPKAEDDIAVASASVVARDRFIAELEKLSTQIGVQLPKGASSQVEEVAQSLIEKHGTDVLNKVAKVHFKTTHKILHPARNVGIQNDKVEENVGADPCVCLKQENEERHKLERLWAPWRIKYIYSQKPDKCIFCEANSRKPVPDLSESGDEEAFVLYRGTKGFVIMNTFPYNNGHLMVAPYRHTASIEELTQEEALSLFGLVQKSVQVLKLKMRPDGFNIGINIGKVAGAGVEGHIHIHIVPRWTGDTNFMPIVSDTKVISQSLEESCKLLKEGFTSLPCHSERSEES